LKDLGYLYEGFGLRDKGSSLVLFLS
jgi:hypothetical protein